MKTQIHYPDLDADRLTPIDLPTWTAATGLAATKVALAQIEDALVIVSQTNGESRRTVRPGRPTQGLKPATL
jgi:hypothetical protein